MCGHKVGNDFHSPVVDPRYVQFLQRTPDYAALASPSDPSLVKSHFGTSHGDLDGLQKACFEVLLAQRKEQFELSLLGKSGGFNHEYYSNPSHRLGTPYPGNLMADSVIHSVGSGIPMFHNERISRFNSMMRSSIKGSVGSWHSDIGNNVEGRFLSSLLDEFKNNKSKSFELSDIVEHVVEFRYVLLSLLFTLMLIISHFEFTVICTKLQYGSVWKSLYSAEIRNCHN